MPEIIKDSAFYQDELIKKGAIKNKRLNGPTAVEIWLSTRTDEEHQAFIQSLGQFLPSFLIYVEFQAKSDQSDMGDEIKRKILYSNLNRQ